MKIMPQKDDVKEETVSTFLNKDHDFLTGCIRTTIEAYDLHISQCYLKVMKKEVLYLLEPIKNIEKLKCFQNSLIILLKNKSIKKIDFKYEYNLKQVKNWISNKMIADNFFITHVYTTILAKTNINSALYKTAEISHSNVFFKDMIKDSIISEIENFGGKCQWGVYMLNDTFLTADYTKVSSFETCELENVNKNIFEVARTKKIANMTKNIVSFKIRDIKLREKKISLLMSRPKITFYISKSSDQLDAYLTLITCYPYLSGYLPSISYCKNNIYLIKRYNHGAESTDIQQLIADTEKNIMSNIIMTNIVYFFTESSKCRQNNLPIDMNEKDVSEEVKKITKDYHPHNNVIINLYAPSFHKYSYKIVKEFLFQTRVMNTELLKYRCINEEIILRMCNLSHLIAMSIKKGYSIVFEDHKYFHISPAIFSLVKLLLDPYYCSTKNLINLIIYEWMRNGNIDLTCEKYKKLFCYWIYCIQYIRFTDPTMLSVDDDLIEIIKSHIYSELYHPFVASYYYGDIFHILLEQYKTRKDYHINLSLNLNTQEPDNFLHQYNKFTSTNIREFLKQRSNKYLSEDRAYCNGLLESQRTNI